MNQYPIAQTVPSPINNPSSPTSQPPPQILWGIPVDPNMIDNSFVGTARRVLYISIASAVFAILSSIISFAMHNNGPGGIVAALLIPACGYYGIKNKNKSLMKLFCCCNFCCVFLFIITTLAVVQLTIPLIQCVCDVNCDLSNFGGGGAINPPGRNNNGLPPINRDRDSNSTLSAKWQDICDHEESIEQTYMAAIGLGAVMAILQCLGGMESTKLLNSSYFAVNSPVSSIAVVGSPVLAYPQTMPYPPNGQPPIMYGYPAPGQNPNNGPVLIPYPMPNPSGGGGYIPTYPGNNNLPYPAPLSPGATYPPPGLQVRNVYGNPTTTNPIMDNNNIPSKVPQTSIIPNYTMVQGFPPLPVNNNNSEKTTTTTTVMYNDENPRN